MITNFNSCFKLNGISFESEKDLLKYSKLYCSAIFPFLTEWFNESESITVQTSGSTGVAKVIRLKKAFMINSAQATGAFFELFENTTALLCLSTEYIAGKMMLVRALTLGWCIDVVQPASNVSITKQYDFSAMVPMQLRASLTNIHKIKKIIIGGGVVSQDLQDDLQDISTKLYATYGMTETITHIAIRKLNNGTSFEKLYYRILPNISIAIDQRGCLCIKAPRVSDDFIKTNDVVELISDVHFQWLGRYDNVINSGGVKLFPEKIEEKISTIISQRFFVTGIKDDVLGEKLVLVVEGETFNVCLDTIGLSKFEMPKQIFFIKKFVETPTKKIQRKKTLALL